MCFIVSVQVGFIFTQSTAERDFIMHTDEVIQAAGVQVRLAACVRMCLGRASCSGLWCGGAEEPWGSVPLQSSSLVGGGCLPGGTRVHGSRERGPARAGGCGGVAQAEVGETCATVVVSWDQTAEDPGGHVHFEAFQCSKQCVQLARDGWLQPTAEGQQPAGVTRVVNPQDPGNKEPVMIGSESRGWGGTRPSCGRMGRGWRKRKRRKRWRRLAREGAGVTAPRGVA